MDTNPDDCNFARLTPEVKTMGKIAEFLHSCDSGFLEILFVPTEADSTSVSTIA